MSFFQDCTLTLIKFAAATASPDGRLLHVPFCPHGVIFVINCEECQLNHRQIVHIDGEMARIRPLVDQRVRILLIIFNPFRRCEKNPGDFNTIRDIVLKKHILGICILGEMISLI